MKIRQAIEVLADYEACRRVAYECVEDAYGSGLDYLELRFSPWFMAEPHQLDAQGVVEAVIDGVNAASVDIGLKVNLLGILSRTYGPEIAWRELQALLAHKEAIVALDLAGDEANYPCDLFTEHFHVARDAGWQVTIHAGESAGAESIWQAIRDLGARRIGHAVRAFEDQSLVDYMAENKIGIEMNLTSNVQTSTVKDYANHPLRIFLERGLLATINTDDPETSGIDLAFEYDFAASQAGLDLAQIHQAQANALNIAFLSEGDKQDLITSRMEA
jgi:adenosine deaminase